MLRWDGLVRKGAFAGKSGEEELPGTQTGKGIQVEPAAIALRLREHLVQSADPFRPTLPPLCGLILPVD